MRSERDLNGVTSQGSGSPVYDVIFVIEATANVGAYFDSLKSLYISPTIKYFNGGQVEDIDYGCTSNCSLYAYVLLNGSDCMPELCTYRAPTTSASVFDRDLDTIDFASGFGDVFSHISVGLSTALAMFDDLDRLRDPHTQAQKHCILVCNSSPYNIPSEYSMSCNSTDKTAEQLASTFSEKSIHFSIISPRKIPELYKLFDLASSDPSMSSANAKNYTTDSRHLVLLSGPELTEQPLSPTVTKQEAEEKTSSLAAARPFAQNPGGPQIRKPVPVVSSVMNQTTTQPAAVVRPNMPAENKVRIMTSQIGMTQQNMTQITRPITHQVNMSAVDNSGPAVTAAGTQNLLAAELMQHQVPQPQSMTQQLSAQQITQQQQINQLQMTQQMNPQQLGQQQIGQQQIGQQHLGQQVNPQPINQQAINQQMSHQNLNQQPINQQVNQAQMGQQPLNQQQQQLKVIWTGTLDWQDRTKTPGETVPALTHSLQCQIGVSHDDNTINASNWTNNLKMMLLPSAMLKPFGEMFKSSRTINFQFNHVQQPNPEDLSSLYKAMIAGFGGYVNISTVTSTPPVPGDVKVMMLLYSQKKSQFMGLIPSDQARFITGIKTVYSKQKQQQLQQQQHGLPGNMANVGAGPSFLQGPAGGLTPTPGHQTMYGCHSPYPMSPQHVMPYHMMDPMMAGGPVQHNQQLQQQQLQLLQQQQQQNIDDQDRRTNLMQQAHVTDQQRFLAQQQMQQQHQRLQQQQQQLQQQQSLQSSQPLRHLLQQQQQQQLRMQQHQQMMLQQQQLRGRIQGPQGPQQQMLQQGMGQMGPGQNFAQMSDDSYDIINQLN